MNDSIITELAGIRLGDKRLERRSIQIISRLHEKPYESFPNIFSAAELEGFYRFVENPYVNAQAVLEPHVRATADRANELTEVLVVHDTSEFIFSGMRKHLEPGERKDSTEFLGHFSIAIEPGSKRPLGVLKMHTWVRNTVSPTSLRKTLGLSRLDVRDLPSEMDRWFDSISSSSALLDRRNASIHVCDSEGDDYALLANLVGNGHRFVIRGCHDRRIEGTSQKLREVLAGQPIVAERTVPLSKRPQPRGIYVKKRLKGRAERTAKLSIRFGKISLLRPVSARRNLPESVSINVAYVLEIDTPEHCEPVEWMLLTTETISSKEDALRVIDIYCARWTIEEYFKALKTGCSYESRQLESYKTLLTCLALFVPVAWLMLLLRHQSRQTSIVAAEQVLPAALIEVLELEARKPMTTAQDVLMAIAAMGGHIKNNGDPGWLVLWRGYRELVTLARGYLLAQNFAAKMSMKRCDQS